MVTDPRHKHINHLGMFHLLSCGWQHHPTLKKHDDNHKDAKVCTHTHMQQAKGTRTWKIRTPKCAHSNRAQARSRGNKQACTVVQTLCKTFIQKYSAAACHHDLLWRPFCFIKYKSLSFLIFMYVRVAGFRVQGSGLGSGFRVQGSGLRVQCSGFRVQGSGFRVLGLGFGVGLGFALAGPLKIKIWRPSKSDQKTCQNNVNF
jgi:hypothetical protein